ncbi:hypothetical protein GCM10017764_20290 [Sphingobacterium griseoflavum]|uniref:Uncharacterized protein n=1 Tax=Sphingobacterium griseoflavum TaxID=1474952 RepID=A0ABQ3HUV9_9SPHI|nr:hypothetical protein GCM10017764_20290 [Sphingobacterium griseoflavum]
MVNVPPLKSFSEEGDGGGGWGAACRKFLATGWVIAVEEPTPAGEIVMSVATVFVAGVLLYEVITCPKKEDLDHCRPLLNKCVTRGHKYVNGIRIKMQCDQCCFFCTSQGYWDYANCPLN